MYEPFKPVRDLTRYLSELEQNNGNVLPVWTGERDDLEKVARIANGMYTGTIQPKPADYGVRAGADIPAPAWQRFFAPLAHRWLEPAELGPLLLSTQKKSVLIVGLYENVSSRIFEEVLIHSHRNDHAIGSLIGRDIHSLLWMTAKQWALPDPDIKATAFLSSESGGHETNGVQIFLEDDFDTQDIQRIILDRPWKNVLFQGHGKDDSINLGDYTICGRNATATASPEQLYPRCGYGCACYKDEDKLLPANEIKAFEIVLSSCNSGPLPQYALYDPKYQLMLNAIDGYAQTVKASLSVHDSDLPENNSWITQAAVDGSPGLEVLNRSLLQQHPYPAYWQIGLPNGFINETDAASDAEAQDLQAAAMRLQSLIVTDLLPPNYPLRERFQRLAHKINLHYSRRVLYADRIGNGESQKSIRSELQSLDHVLKERILANPEDDVMNFGAYYNDRGTIDAATQQQVACSCGSTAFSFLRRGHLPSYLNLRNLLCLRCGDKDFRLEGAPVIRCTAKDKIRKGEPLEVSVHIDVQEKGPVHAGLFVPRYLRESTVIEPAAVKLAGKKGATLDLSFTLRFLEDVFPQAYYFTIFTVQNLSLSTCRQHFGIEL